MENVRDNTDNGMPDEASLIRRILDGDVHLFRVLTGKYAGMVMSMVARLIHSPEEAEEVTQDVLLEAYNNLARFDARRAAFQTWLASIACHTALKHYRKRRKAVEIIDVEQQWLNSVSDEDADELLNDTAPDRVEIIRKAIGMLKPDDQMLLGFYYFDNRPIREIACIMQRNESYFRSRLQWIRKRLAFIIKTFESDEEQ